MSAGDGLLQRFQLVAFPAPRERKLVDLAPDEAAETEATRAFLRACDRPPLTADSCEGLPYLRLDDAAQALFDEWQASNIEEVEAATRQAPAWAAHLAKYGSLVASLALAFHLAEHGHDERDGAQPSGPVTPVGRPAAALAVRWAGWLADHAKIMYRGVLDGAAGDSLRLLESIECGSIPDGATLREVLRGRSRGWNRDRLRSAIGLLEKCGAVRVERVKPAGGGRPSKILRVNPNA